MQCQYRRYPISPSREVGVFDFAYVERTLLSAALDVSFESLDTGAGRSKAKQ